MLNKNITYEVLFDEDKVGEIKNNIYYDAHGRELYVVKENHLLHEDRMIGPISIEKNGVILTRFIDEQIFFLKPKD